MEATESSFEKLEGKNETENACHSATRKACLTTLLWKAGAAASLPLIHPTGFFFPQREKNRSFTPARNITNFPPNLSSRAQPQKNQGRAKRSPPLARPRVSVRGQRIRRFVPRGGLLGTQYGSI
jgi:hypothetical protein